MKLAAGHELVCELALPAIQTLPKLHGVIVVKLTGFDDKLVVVMETHTCVLGVGIGGEEGGGPEEGFESRVEAGIIGNGGALEKEFAVSAIGTCGALGDGGIKFIHAAEVCAGSEIDGSINGFCFQLGKGADPIELVTAGGFKINFRQAFWSAVNERDAASFEHFTIHLCQQCFCGWLRGDAYDVAGFDIGGVTDEDICPACEV